MQSVNVILLLSFTLQIYFCNGSKILGVFPLPSKSHYILGEAMLKTLAERGHEVTMISPYSLGKPMKNYKEVVIDGILELKERYGRMFTNPNNTIWKRLQVAYEVFPALFHSAHNASNVREFVRKQEKFDLCIVAFSFIESMFGVCNIVQAPAIGFNVIGFTFFISYHTNNPVPYSYVPHVFSSQSDQMSFLDRVANIVLWSVCDLGMHFIVMPYQSRLSQHYYPRAPPLHDIMKDVDLYLLNCHVATESPVPLLPNIIPIGGFHLQILEELPKEVKTFLDNSQTGVIYFSMGSNTNSSDMDPTVIDVLLRTFSKVHYDVLWKYELDFPSKPKNLHTAAWLPQRTVLMHPNIKMFITHGGLGGTVEAIYAGIPMICMPIFGDQGKNCANSVRQGYAKRVNLIGITEAKLLNAITEISRNKSYKENVLMKSDLYRNQEMNPMDKAMFWIEHVIKHKGAKHMKSRASSTPWYQYYLLDVFGFFASILAVSLAFWYFLIKLVAKIWCLMSSKVMEVCKILKDSKIKKIKKH